MAISCPVASQLLFITGRCQHLEFAVVTGLAATMQDKTILVVRQPGTVRGLWIDQLVDVGIALISRGSGRPGRFSQHGCGKPGKPGDRQAA